MIPFDGGKKNLDTSDAIPLKRVEYRHNNAFMRNLTVSVNLRPMLERTGWEWFDPIREDPRFLACLERIKKLAATD